MSWAGLLEFIEFMGACILLTVLLCGGIIVSVALNGPGCPCSLCKRSREMTASKEDNP